MLALLRIQQLAVIDELEVEFTPGLNVVTGETGSGKSVVVAALKLVLGARGRADLVRTGARRAVVEALFEGAHLAQRLEALGLDPDEQIAVRRVVMPTGRSRATVNGQLATNAQLARLTAGLVDISSQHEHHSLVDTRTHLPFLDAFANLHGERALVAEASSTAGEALVALTHIRARLADRVEREALLRFQIAEISKTGPRRGEDVELHAERERLQHATELRGAATAAIQRLRDGDRSASTLAVAAATEVEHAARHAAQLGPLAAQIRSAVAELEDVAHELTRFGHSLEANPARLDAINERLRALDRLQRSYGPTLEHVLAHADRAAVDLAALDDIEGDTARLQAAFNAALEVAGARARALSTRRQAAAGLLSAAFTAELRALGMGGATVAIDVAPLEGGAPELQVEGARLSPTGIDRVEFRIAPNPGDSPRALSRVASGGELSRALLGLKRVLAGIGTTRGLYVFDEVDTGVGGAIAQVIGRKIAEVASHHQVLCITHLPQIAAFGDRHLRISKQSDGATTQVRVEYLDEEQRLDELAGMLGGARLTPAKRQAAAELISATAPAWTPTVRELQPSETELSHP
jgi:DNA repair protein RecN (Recombination protein N)